MALIVKQMPEISQHFCRLEAEGIDIIVFHNNSDVIFGKSRFKGDVFYSFACNGGAEGRKKYAPPVFAPALADFHTNGIVIACGNGKAVVNTCVELHIGEISLHIVVKAASFYGKTGDIFDFTKQITIDFILTVAAFKQVCMGYNCIADLYFQPLVDFRIGIGKNVQACYLVFKPVGRQHQRKAEQGENGHNCEYQFLSFHISSPS